MEKEMDWLVSMPKIELHAHLNGSIRDSTLLELGRELGEKGTVAFSEVEDVILKNDRSLMEVFKLFDLIHILTTDHKTVTRITKEVIEDFAADNVVYLELRTTPKRNGSKGMSKRSYVEAVLEGIRSVNAVEVDLYRRKLDEDKPIYPTDGICLETGRKKIYVRLLLSIDRREDAEAAMETIKLALEMRDMGVVGIDLSGNPNIGGWMTFVPALEFAKKQGLQITLHCGEVPNPDEIRAMLNFLPQRIGHACCLEDNEWNLLKKLDIPRVFRTTYKLFTTAAISTEGLNLTKPKLEEAKTNGFLILRCDHVEICLTSNIRTETIASVDIHHFADLYKSNHPLILCTDDAGVFSTSLSTEYFLASSTFGLGKKDMYDLAQKAVDFIFACDGVKRELKLIFQTALKKLHI